MVKEETDVRNLAVFKKKLTGRAEGADKRLDVLHRELSIVKSNSADILQLRTTVNETHTCVKRSDDHTTAQGVKSTLVMGNLMGRRFWVGRGCFFLGGRGRGRGSVRASTAESFSQDDALSNSPIF